MRRRTATVQGNGQFSEIERLSLEILIHYQKHGRLTLVHENSGHAK